MMTTEELILNIAVNMGRLSKWAMEGKKEKVKQFISDTEIYINQLESIDKNERFKPTYTAFARKFAQLKRRNLDEIWAEDALTWANILTHRAKLA